MVFEMNPKFEYRQDRFLRRLHLDGSGVEKQNIRKKIVPMVVKAASLVRLHGIVVVGEQEFETGIAEADQKKAQLIFLCWACREAVTEIGRLSEQGKLMEAYLLDQLVNDSLFHASVSLEQAAGRLLPDRGLQIQSVCYPEDKSQDPALLGRLLDQIKAETEVEVSMNKAGLLEPSKTILYVAGAGPVQRQDSGVSGSNDSQQSGCGQVPDRQAGISREEDPYGTQGCSGVPAQGRHDCANCKKRGCAFRINP